MTDGVTTLELSKRTIQCLRAYLQKASTRDCEEQADLRAPEMEAVNLLRTVLIALDNIIHTTTKMICSNGRFFFSNDGSKCTPLLQKEGGYCSI
jgi:hypothetical protein